MEFCGINYIITALGPTDRHRRLVVLDVKLHKTLHSNFWGFPCVVTRGREGLWFVCVLYDGRTKGSTQSISGEAENRTCDPWFTRYSTYPLHLFVAFLCINQFRRVGLRFVLVLCREHPKAHRKWFYGEAVNRTCVNGILNIN